MKLWRAKRHFYGKGIYGFVYHLGHLCFFESEFLVLGGQTCGSMKGFDPKPDAPDLIGVRYDFMALAFLHPRWSTAHSTLPSAGNSATRGEPAEPDPTIARAWPSGVRPNSGAKPPSRENPTSCVRPRIARSPVENINFFSYGDPEADVADEKCPS